MPLIAPILFIGILVTTFLRLFYGIDFTDESYYIVMPLRFARGDQPFVDELFINQTGAILITPLIKLFYQWRGSTEGIVLFVRLAYFAFSLLVGINLIYFFKKHVSLGAAFLLGGITIAILPLDIPTLSYNSIASLSFTLALFLGLNASFEKRALGFALSGICLAIAVFAYPSLVLACMIFVCILLGYSENRWKNFLSLIGGTLLALICFSPTIFHAGTKLSTSLIYTFTSFDHGGGWPKFKMILQHVFVSNVPNSLYLVFLWVGIALYAKSKTLRWMGLSLLPILVLTAFSRVIFTQIWFVFYLSFFGPLVFWGLNKTPLVKRLFFAGWLPSFIAGLSISWTSSSSAINGALGLVPAFVCTCFFLKVALSQKKIPEWRSLAPITVAIFLLAFTQFSGKAFYRDQNFSNLTQRILSGPYRGLYTSVEKFSYLQQITADIKRVENREGKILFYEFPAGYLISSMRPGVNSTWIRDISRGKQFYADYYAAHFNPKNVVFEITWLCHERSQMQKVRYFEEDPLARFINETHHVVLATPNYRVFIPNS